jgi:hypothetical protein
VQSVSIFPLAYPLLDAFALIGRENMRESTFFQEILAEGRVEMGRSAVLDALTIRFGRAAAAEFTDRLNAIQDAEQLLALHRTAIKCRGVGGFRRALRTSRSQT